MHCLSLWCLNQDSLSTSNCTYFPVAKVAGSKLLTQIVHEIDVDVASLLRDGKEGVRKELQMYYQR
jgi:hypothetical protein